MRLMPVVAAIFLSSAAMAGGADLFAATCSACHGMEGKGDGAAAVALDPKPADFSDASFWETRDDAHLKKVITEGGAAVGKSPLMAPFGGALTSEQIDEIIAHLKTFKP